MILFSLLFACAQSEKSEDSSAPPSDGDTAAEAAPTSAPEDHVFTGTAPAEALAAADFTALNFDGEDRNKDNLIGQATVMWFFPLADTPG